MLKLNTFRATEYSKSEIRSIEINTKFSNEELSLLNTQNRCFYRFNKIKIGWIYIWVVRGVMVIVVGSGHDDPSSNPGREWLYFT